MNVLVAQSGPTLCKAHQTPLSMGFSRQEYWSGLPFPSPGALLNPGIKSGFPALQADSLPSESVCTNTVGTCGTASNLIMQKLWFMRKTASWCLFRLQNHYPISYERSLYLISRNIEMQLQSNFRKKNKLTFLILDF